MPTSSFKFYLVAIVTGLFGALLYLTVVSSLSTESDRPTSYASVLEKALPAVASLTIQLERAPLGTDEQPGKIEIVGSGVVVNSNGMIVTNHHLVKDSLSIQVSLENQRPLQARLIGSDPTTDLALIKIEQNNLPYLELVKNQQPHVGDIVFAIGNPFGVGLTVTQGIVSAMGRGGLGLSPIEDFIQTDAAINPGNSGGALLNAKGELIGINAALFGESGDFSGIGFAVPTDILIPVLNDLVNFGTVLRGDLGVKLHRLSEEEAKFFNLPSQAGLMVIQIDEQGPAEKAGIRPGDILLSYNQHPLNSTREAINLIALSRPQTQQKIGYQRNGVQAELEVVIGQADHTSRKP